MPRHQPAIGMHDLNQIGIGRNVEPLHRRAMADLALFSSRSSTSATEQPFRSSFTNQTSAQHRNPPNRPGQPPHPHPQPTLLAPGPRPRYLLPHELAHRIRPPQDPHAVHPIIGAGQPLAPMPGLPADDLPPRPRRQPQGVHATAATTCGPARPSGWNGPSTPRPTPGSNCPSPSPIPLKFRDTKRYADRLKEARETTQSDG